MNKRNIVVYVSGKYTESNPDGSFNSDRIEDNINIARKYAIKIWELGFTVICPHLNTYHFERDCGIGYRDYMDGDLELVERSDIIFMIPENWQNSKGAIEERGLAIKLGRGVAHNLEELVELSKTYKRLKSNESLMEYGSEIIRDGD